MFKTVEGIVKDITAKIWNAYIDTRGVVDFMQQINKIYAPGQQGNHYFTTTPAC